MSTAAKTPNYNLSQVAGSDIPDWITDYTSDMSKIDDALKENADDITTVRPDEFSEESTYAAGDYCIKDNVIYKAKTAVEAGAFDISDWTATTIFDELSGLNQNMTLLEASWTPNTNFSGSAHKIGKKRMIYIETGWLPWTSEKQIAGWTSDIPAVIESKYAIMMNGSGAPMGICNVDIGDDTVISITPPTDWVSGTSAHIRAWISYYIG